MSAKSRSAESQLRAGLRRLSPTREIGCYPLIDRLCAILAVAGIAALAIHRWLLIGPYPPGLDGAQWLALGRGLDGIGRSTEGAYAPLGPVLATLAEAAAGPLPAVRLLATLSALAISLVVWFVANDTLGAVWGLAVSALVIPASALAEPLFFGGYPQHLALAAGVLALWASCRYLVRADGKGLWVAGIAAIVAASAHHVYFPVFALAILVAVGLWLPGPAVGARVARARALMIALAPAVGMFAIVVVAFFRAGYTAPLRASARSPADAWVYGTRESPVLWFLIVLAGAGSLLLQWRMRRDLVWLLPASLLLSTGPLFLLSGQPRLLPPLIIGAALAAGLGARRVSAIGPQVRLGVLGLAFAIATTLVVPANRASARFADFYRVVDESLVRAAAAIEADGGFGTVAVRQDRRGWPIGWWFEALLKQPVIVGSDPQWLAFPEEWRHAGLAEALFDGGLDADAFRQRATAASVRYLVVAKWDWIGWERWMRTPDFPVVKLYDDDQYLVLRVT